MNHFAVWLKLTVLQFKKKELKAIWTFSSSASRVYCLPTSICPSSSPSSCPLDASWPEPLPACCLGAAWLLLAGDAWSLMERWVWAQGLSHKSKVSRSPEAPSLLQKGTWGSNPSPSSLLTQVSATCSQWSERIRSTELMSTKLVTSGISTVAAFYAKRQSPVAHWGQGATVVPGQALGAGATGSTPVVEITTGKPTKNQSDFHHQAPATLSIIKWYHLLPWKSLLLGYALNQKLADFFCKGPDSKYCWFFKPYHLSHSYSKLLLTPK